MKQEHPFDALWSRGMRGFGTWDEATTRLFDQVLRTRALLEPLATSLSAQWRAKALLRRLRDASLREAGVATADDLARAHAATLRVEARLLDLLEAQQTTRRELAALREQLERDPNA